MLSLAKLALLASDEHPQKVEEAVSVMNRDLDLVVYQEELPEVVLSSYGYDVERLRVLTPTELIKVRFKGASGCEAFLLSLSCSCGRTSG